MALTRAQIEAANDLAPAKEVAVPEWGGSVFVRQMDAGEHARLGLDYESLPKDQVVFYVLSLTVCDETGATLFPGENGRASLARKNKDVISRLFEEASKLNKLMPADVEAAEKN